MVNINYSFFLPYSLLPSGFEYPDDYNEFVEKEIMDIYPWRFYHAKKNLSFHFEGLKKRYPSRKLVPFARRVDNDDVACFDASVLTDNPKVLIIHDFASEGWEGRGICDNFLSWLQLAIDESEEYKEWMKKNKMDFF